MGHGGQGDQRGDGESAERAAAQVLHEVPSSRMRSPEGACGFGGPAAAPAVLPASRDRPVHRHELGRCVASVDGNECANVGQVCGRHFDRRTQESRSVRPVESPGIGASVLRPATRPSRTGIDRARVPEGKFQTAGIGLKTSFGGPMEQVERPGESGGPGRDPLSRRRFGVGVLSFGGALVVAPLGTGSAAADDSGRAANAPLRPAGHGTTLRHGSAARAGLLAEHVDEVTAVAERYLGPSPRHPYWAGAVVLAGRGGTVALEKAVGKAVRYQDYDSRPTPPSSSRPTSRSTRRPTRCTTWPRCRNCSPPSSPCSSSSAAASSWRRPSRAMCRSTRGAASRTSQSGSCSPTPRGSRPTSPSTNSAAGRRCSRRCGTRSRSTRPGPSICTPTSA